MQKFISYVFMLPVLGGAIAFLLWISKSLLSYNLGPWDLIGVISVIALLVSLVVFLIQVFSSPVPGESIGIGSQDILARTIVILFALAGYYVSITTSQSAHALSGGYATAARVVIFIVALFVIIGAFGDYLKRPR